MTKAKFLAAMAAAAIWAAPASADVIFTLSGPASATFTLPDSLAPDDSDDFSFRFFDVSGTFEGEAQIFASITFFTEDFLGGLGADVGETTVFEAIGAQLFSGSTASPTFLPGIYELTSTDGLEAYTLSIADIADVPEPAAIALFGLGLAGVGVSRRKKPA